MCTITSQFSVLILFAVPMRCFIITLFIEDIGGGYVCFVISIICIGLVTAVIGDVASHFGCTLGIKDSVTAIVFVALGTSIPGQYLVILYNDITVNNQLYIPICFAHVNNIQDVQNRRQSGTG